MLYILIVLVFIFVLLFAMDIIWYIRQIFMRFHSGRFIDEREWEEAVLIRLIAWSKKMPVVTMLDQRRLIILDVIQGKFKNKTIQSWQAALVYLAVSEYYNSNGMQDKIEVLIAREIGRDGNWKQEPEEIDTALLAYYLLKYAKDIDSIKPAMDTIYRLILERRGADGLICYRKSSGHLRFVDTLGLVCPFLCAYGKIYNVKEASQLAIEQVQDFERYGIHPDYCMPVHAYDANTKIPMGLYGWGRGLVWYLLALCECYEILDNTNLEKRFFEELILEKSDLLTFFQKENGGVGWIIQNKDTYDSSATAGYAYFYAIVYRICRDKKFYDISQKALKCLMASTQRNGAVDYSQGDTKGIGMYSNVFSIMPFTQGLTYLTICKLSEEF
ncbi:MAG: glycoside hydrolase family 88 protein [Blautia sp.]|uniref:glycoside hydrolase family 88 protein n=1 Tax=Blautia sp. TaxID=1955243 RepID=UPI00399103E0